jgi:hypothetical protein
MFSSVSQKCKVNSATLLASCLLHGAELLGSQGSEYDVQDVAGLLRVHSFEYMMLFTPSTWYCLLLLDRPVRTSASSSCICRWCICGRNPCGFNILLVCDLAPPYFLDTLHLRYCSWDI